MDLTLTYRGVVYPWQCDHMGHMNVMWYVGKFDEATWHVFNSLGLTPAYFRDQSRGMAALEQQISYKRELRAGDLLTIRSGVLEIKEKLVRFYHEMRKEGTGEVAATTTLLAVHLDTTLRKSCPLPASVIEHGRALLVTI